MSEEEKKAIKVIEEINKRMEYKYDKKIGQYVCIALRHRDRKVFKTLLNLIKKQQKEIADNDSYKVSEVNEYVNRILEGFVSKAKIREKIKELEHKDFTAIQVVMKHDKEALKIVDVLKELLEE